MALSRAEEAAGILSIGQARRSGAPWTAEEDRAACNLPWHEFSALYPGRTKMAWQRRWSEATGDLPPAPPPLTTTIDTLNNRADKRQQRGEMTQRALLVEVVEELLSAVVALPPLQPSPPPLPQPVVAGQELVLVLSDLHVGERVDAAEMGGLGHYNFDVFLERLEKIHLAVVEAASLHKICRLNVFALGDFVTGQTIFKGQEWRTDRHVFAQAVEGAQAIAAFLASLSAIFPEIHFFDVFGNHGRLGQKGEAPLLANFDHLCYLLIEAYSAQYPTIRFQHSESWFQVVQRGNAKFTLVHGDDVRALMTGGMERAAQRYTKLLGMPMDYFICGHHHTPLKTDNLIANGSFVGPTDFSAKALMAGGLPSQKLLVVNPGQGIVTWTCDIVLSDWGTMRNIRVYEE